MTSQRVFLLTVLAMLAFAGNGILGRLALTGTAIDPVTFTAIRLVCGASVLTLLPRFRGRRPVARRDLPAAIYLFVYMAAVSFAYGAMPVATGALLLFGTVQATMIIAGLVGGEALNVRQVGGFMLAVGGLVSLLLPGLARPPIAGVATAVAGGIARGIYSLRGRQVADPEAASAGNFLIAALLAVLVSASVLPWSHWDASGAALAALSGGLTSGIGYLVWYAALRGLSSTHAAVVQLSVPILIAVGGITFLGESVSVRFVFASTVTMGGIALVILERAQRRSLKSI